MSLLAIAIAAPASAYRVVRDSRLEGTTQSSFGVVTAIRCGVTLHFPGSDGKFLHLDGVGAGDNVRLEHGEELDVMLPAASRHVTYRVGSATNLDGDGTIGESYVEAFDENETTLGVVALTSTGEKDVTALFGGVPINRYTVIGGDDGIRLRSFGYDLPAGVKMTTVLGLSNGDPYVAESFEQCSVTFRGIPRAAHLGAGGVSVAGGNAESWQDGDEDLEIEFAEPVPGAGYQLDDATNVNGGTLGGHLVEAFDANGDSLGLRSASGLEPIELTDPSFFGPVAISRFVLIGVADQIRLGRIFFVPEPVGAAPTAALVLASLAAIRTRGRR